MRCHYGNDAKHRRFIRRGYCELERTGGIRFKRSERSGKPSETLRPHHSRVGEFRNSSEEFRNLFFFRDYPTLFGVDDRKKLNHVKIALLRAVMDADSIIKKQGATTLIMFMIEVAYSEKDTVAVKIFQDCMERIYPVVDETIKQSDTEVLKALIDLVEACPKIFRHDVLAIFDFGLAVEMSVDVFRLVMK